LPKPGIEGYRNNAKKEFEENQNYMGHVIPSFYNTNMPNQYARVKNVAKGENVIKKNTDQTNVYVDEFLEEAMKKSKVQVFIKQMKMLIMNIGHQTIMLIQHLG
jgi:peroxiredoxin family protein